MTEIRDPLLYDPTPEPADGRILQLDPALTVNEVMLRFPPSAAVFNAFGVDACCGGASSLTDAAEQVGIAPAALLGTLEATIVPVRLRPMKMIEPREAARTAVSARQTRPATAVIHDSEDARLVVFRLAAVQEVAPHASTSTVVLTVLEGTGTLSGFVTERVCSDGAVVAYAPGELHGMRATDGELLLLATITPRPGSR